MRFRRAPLAAAAAWFACGIVLAHVAYRPGVLLVAGLLLLVIAAAFSLRFASRVAWVAGAALWIVLGFCAALWQPIGQRPPELAPYADRLSRTVRGTVVRVQVPPPLPALVSASQAADADSAPTWESAEVEESPQQAKPLSVDLAVDAIEEVTPDTSSMVPMTGGLRVSLYQAPAEAALAPLLHCGDRVEVPLRLKLPQRYRDPGAFQYADFLQQQGIVARSSASATRLRVIGANPATLRCRLFAAQSWASERLLGFAASAQNRRLPVPLRLMQADALMLDAMLFGDRSGLSHTMRVGFERTGSFHLFVVSGLHIALLAGGVFWLLRKLRFPLWAATMLTLLATTAYAALTGFGQPAQRSLAMTAVFLLARLLSRDRDSLNALGAALLAMLVWAPASLFDASFQMTALVVVAIAGIAVPLGRYTFLRSVAATRNLFGEHRGQLPPRQAQLRLMLEMWGETLAGVLGQWARRLPAFALRAVLWAFELALVGVVAELVMTLPMAVYFHRAAVFALPANMLVIPIIAVLVPAAIATFAGALLSPWLALVPGAFVAWLLHLLTYAIHRVSVLDAADVRVPGPVWWVAVLAIVAWGACLWLVRRGRLGALATAIALPLIAAMILWPEHAPSEPGALEVTAIDVGQGDSLLAVNPEGSTMLIDAGGPVGQHGVSEIVSNFDVGEEVVSPYLWSRRIRRIDVVVLSHAHTDHMGGMPAILENFHPRELWLGSDPHSPLYDALLAQAARQGIVVRHFRAGERIAWGSVAIRVLAPAPAYVNLGSPRNDDSLVLRMQFGKSSVLLEGDAERPSEEAMLAAGLVTPVTLLKVGHHGSRTSSTPEFLAAAAPQDAVISVGRFNTFGHPRGEVIARFAERGTHLFRTDEFGLTSFLLSRDGTLRERVGDTLLLPTAAPSTAP